MKKPLNTPNVTGNDLVVAIDIKSINEEERVIIADCLDSDDKIIANDAYFKYPGIGKNVPFILTKTEINQIKEGKNEV